ncbi:MAG: protein kinase, partial [Phycisphaerales bacterium]|nr:protein kinase [Phycisphaerales bacterium]
MDAAQHERVRRVFLSAIQLEGDSRTDYIRRACGPDARLRSEIESLLAHHDRPVSPIDSPALGGISETIATELPPPTRVGPYRVVRVLGEGAMGVVYLAEQLAPRREVALKVIRPGIVSPSLQRRFEREVEILGRLQHPGIAQIYDAGSATVANGSAVPYFAMELVRGERLVDYANRRGLDRRHRLRLLVRICDAVQHAHLNGIIHRDLKPANILVADDPNDPEAIGQPKILDFGIARCTADDLAATLRTDAGQILGTLAYMAPEQADGTLGGVDARADVHALGVIAFELLTGQLPRSLVGQSIVGAARVIQEQPPRRLAAVDRTLRGDLDTIVARATDPEPPRRYQSPAELAADIDRWLAGEPVLTRRDSIAYLLRRHVRRYRWSLAASLVFIVLAGSFAVYATTQARRQARLAASESDARQVATRERNEALAARERESEARTTAERAAHRAASVTSFVTSALGMADPDVRLSSSASVGDLLRATSETVGTALADQPDLEADIRAVIGRASFAQGDPASARPQLERAYDLRRADPLATPDAVYDVLWPLFQAIDDLGEYSFENLRADAATVGRAVLAETQAPLAERFAALDGAVGSDRAAPSADLAWRSAEAVLAPTAAEWSLVGDLFTLAADRLQRRRRIPEAVTCLERALDAYGRILPPTNSRAVRATDALTEILLEAGRYAEAARLSEEAILQASAVLPAEHWYLAAERAQLGAALAGLGQTDDAIRTLDDSLSVVSAQIGNASASAIRTLRRLVEVLERTGDLPTAEMRRHELDRALAASSRPVGTVDEVGVGFGRGHADLEASLRLLQSAVANRSASLGEPVAAVLASSARLAPGDPIGALTADLLSQWAQSAINRSNRGEDAVPMLLEAVRLDGLAPLRHPRKMALPLWFLGRRAE